MTAKANGELIPIGGGDTIPLIRERLTIGRRESSDICLRFPNVSGLHCELVFREGHWIIRDLGSTNGIRVNDQRVQHQTLRPGDEIGIAKRRFIIQYVPSGPEPIDDESAEDEVLRVSLLEKAGLSHPERPRKPRPKPLDPSGMIARKPEEGQ